MKIKRYVLCLLPMLLFALPVFAAIPPINLYLDVSDPNPQKFDFSVRAGNTPIITVYCQTNSAAYTNFGSGWSPEFNYFQSDSASAGVTVTGTLVSTTGIITFNTLTNTFPAQGQFFAEVYLYSGVSPKITIGQGKLTVLRSPSSGSIASLNITYRLNWDLITSIGTVPWSNFDTNILQAQITANLAAQANTNTGFQSAITNLNGYSNYAFLAWSWGDWETNGLATTNQLNAASNYFRLTDGTLQTNINLTSNALNLAIGAVQTNLNTASNYFRLADGAIQTNLNTASNYFLLVDGTLQTNLNTASNVLRSAIGAVQTNLNTASNALNLAIGVVQTNLNTASNTLDTARANVQTNLNVASNYFRLVDGTLQTNINIASNALKSAIGAVQTNLNTASNTLDTARANLQTNLNTASNAYVAADAAEADTRGTADTNLDTRVTTLEGAGYITSTTNIFTALYVADRSQLGTNIAGLIQGVYTGAVNSVAYTGVTVMVVNRTYAWGYTKIGASGTSTLAIASQSLLKTSAGNHSNYFTYTGTDTNLILTLDGTGLAQCNVSNVYVRQITNGNMYVAGNAYVAGDVLLGQTNSIQFPDGRSIKSQDVTNWNLGLSQLAVATTDVGVLKGRTGVWNQAATDASASTQYIGTNTLQAQITANLTNQNATNTVLQANINVKANTTNTVAGYGITDAYTKVQSDAAYAPTGAVGSISNDVDVLQGKTGTWDAVTGKVDITTFSSHTNNESAGILHLTAAEKATATNPPSTNGLASTNWVIGRGYVTNAFGWSGIQATGQIFWVQTVVTTSSVLTNLTVTGTLDPDITVGTFTITNDFGGQPSWFNSNVNYFSWSSSSWILSSNRTEPASGLRWQRSGTSPTGTFLPLGGATGTATVDYAYVTNLLTTTNTWRAGFDGTNWTVSLNGTNQIDATNVATKVQGLLADTAMQSLAWTNSVISFTNAVIASTQSLDSAVANLNTNAVLKTGGIMSGALTTTAFKADSIVLGTNASITNWTDWSLPFQSYSATVNPGAGETCTIVYASGSLVKITATNGLTTLTFDNTDYPTNGVNRVGVELWAGTNDIGFATATITNATTPTVSTSSWTSLFYRKSGTNKWTGRD